MSKFQLFNGEFYPHGEKLLDVSNRGFRYGDGFFESMRISNGKAPFVKEHWQRLVRATDFLRIRIPETLTQQSFHQYAMALSHRNGYKNARVRFQGYRMGTGKYAPNNNSLGWAMVCQEVEYPAYQLNKNGLNVGFCTSHRINPAPQSSFKSSNALPYVLGGIYAEEQKLDDCLLLDAEGFIAEAISSNIFLLKGKQLVTPDLSNGGVAGVMRSIVLQEAGSSGFSVAQRLVSKDDVLEADECFLTNAAQGIQWVGAVEKKRFYKRGAEKMIDHINSKFGLL